MSSSDARKIVYGEIARVRGSWTSYKQRVIDAELGYDAIFAEAEVDAVLADMKLLPLIESIPGVGKVKSRRALESCGIGETRKIATFDAATQAALRDALGLADG